MQTSKEKLLKRIGLVKEGTVVVLTEDQQMKQSIENLIGTFALCCSNLDLALTETTKLASTLEPKKRRLVSEGLFDIFNHLERSIAEAKSILSFDKGSEAYRC